MTKENARNLFPHTQSGRIYFNHASIGPLATPVAEAIKNYADERSFGKIKNFDDYLETEKAAKSGLAKLIGCNEEGISWVDNVSNAMNILAQGLHFEKDDEIILTDIEFPSNVYPFLNLARKGVKVLFAKSENGKIPPENITSLITGKTRLISVSYVQFFSGWRSDIRKLGKICKAENIIFSVDGIQGAGALYPDLSNCHIDFFAGGTQKWIMALQGLSYFYISPALLEQIDQTFLGWLSVSDPWSLLNYETTPKPDASRFQTGTQNALATFALNASLEIFHSFGIKNVEREVLANSKEFIKKLQQAGFNPLLAGAEEKNLSGIVTVPCNNATEAVKYLAENNITAEIREKHIRFSPHYYNTFEEINRCAELLERFN